MKHTMTKPCDNCPFRTDVKPYLRPERAEEIVESLYAQQSFPCHKTTKSDEDGLAARALLVLGEEEECGVRVATEEWQQCAGAMIMLEKMGRSTQMMRICERFGAYDHKKLDMGAPVYDDGEEMIEAYENEDSFS